MKIEKSKIFTFLDLMLEKMLKSLRRCFYLDLVKTFHPDRELDEAEKIRKTAIMQRVTDAYEKNDLLVLLELQLEFERIDAQSLNSIAQSPTLLTTANAQ